MLSTIAAPRFTQTAHQCLQLRSHDAQLAHFCNAAARQQVQAGLELPLYTFDLNCSTSAELSSHSNSKTLIELHPAKTIQQFRAHKVDALQERVKCLTASGLNARQVYHHEPSNLSSVEANETTLTCAQEIGDQVSDCAQD